MRIKKVSQTTPTPATVVNTKSNSQTNTYSCDYINNKQNYLGKTNLYDTEENALDLNSLSIGRYYLKHNSTTDSFWIKATYKGNSQTPVTRTKQITLFPNISTTRVIQNTIILYIDKAFDENTTSLTAIGSITETYEDQSRPLSNKFYMINLNATGIGTGSAVYEKFDIDKHTVLYNNESGSTQTITLSDSAANYDYLEIYFATNDGNSNYVKVTNPNGKNVVLFSNDVESSTVVWFKMKNIAISGTNITIRNTKAIKITNNSSSLIYEDSGVIKIIKVIGIKNAS